MCKYKKYILFILILIFTFLFYQTVVFAGGKINPQNDNGVLFSNFGSLMLITEDKIATSDIRYRTVGWTIYPTAITTNGKSAQYSCDLGDGRYVIKDTSKGFAAVVRREGNENVLFDIKYEDVKSKNPKYYQFISNFPGYEKKADNLKDGYIITVFEIDKKTITNSIRNANSAWHNKLYANGDWVIIDSIMIVTGDPKKAGIEYTTLNGIKYAEKWADKDELDTHYNKAEYFDPHPEMLTNTSADLVAAADRKKVQTTGEDVNVTLDSSKSFAIQDGNDAGINKRTYWASTNMADLNDPTKGHESMEDKIRLSVAKVLPNSIIHCKVEIFSQKLYDLYLTDKTIKYTDSKTVDIVIGTNIPITQQDLQANAKGDILADDAHNKNIHFDVLKGIPTSEYLYTDVRAKNYLYQFGSIEETGSKMYNTTVKKTYNLHWLDQVTQGNEVVWVDRYDTQTVTRVYPVVRDYSYWVIHNLEVYDIEKADINNKALPGDHIVLMPKASTGPKIDYTHSDKESDHLVDPNTVVDLGSESIDDGKAGKPSVPVPDEKEWRQEAENGLGPIMVNNDSLSVDGKVVMKGEKKPTDTDNPENFPQSGIVKDKTLFRDDLEIDGKKQNKVYDSTGTIYYKRMEKQINGTEPEAKDDIQVNDVTVHTPVVCYPEIKDDKAFNQEVTPKNDRISLILGRTTTITFPTAGQHNAYPGYGNRDYIKYLEAKQIRCPFDIYYDGKFVRGGNWYTVTPKDNTIQIKIPIWVDEKNYNIEFREIPINADEADGTKTETSANKNLNNYVAVKSIPVRTIGRLYGLRVTDINNYPLWEKGVFRTDKGTTTHTNNYYYVGTRDQNGNAKTGFNAQFTLPIFNGSHPKYKSLGALKTGYGFKFELTTVGQYYGDTDFIDIIPKFYYADKNNPKADPRPVELWYSEKFDNKDNYFVKLGSDKDQKNIKYIKLGDPYRNVPSQEIKNTSSILKIPENTLKNESAKLGWFDHIMLTKPLRTFVGDPSGLSNEIREGVDAAWVRKSIQKWYGEYYLPDASYFAFKDDAAKVENYLKTKRVTGDENFWIKDGYIVVRFLIQTVKNKDADHPALRYWGSPNCDMWNVEGFNYSKKDYDNLGYTLEDGDIMFYYPNKRSSDDFSSGGTH